MPSAFITGITGQDGSYLAESLLARGYTVHGLIRPGGDPAQTRIAGIAHRLHLHFGHLADAASVAKALAASQPAELYHLASQTDPGAAFADPILSAEVNAMGTLRLLELVRSMPTARRPKVFHASSAQVFGHPRQSPQNESTPFEPVNLYGSAKAFATQVTRNYRDNYGIFAVNGILFNHESPRRGPQFVTAKICRAAAAIRAGTQNELTLRNTTSQRDWGDAREYVEGFWLALQHRVPQDYVFATGHLHSVQDVIEIAFATAGLDWRQHLRVDESLNLPAEPGFLVGDATRAREVLGWQPRKPFKDLIEEMTRAAMDAVQGAKAA